MTDSQKNTYTTTNFHNLIIQSSPENILDLYNLSTPYQVILETCRDNDEHIIVYQFSRSGSFLFSPAKSFFSQRPQHQHSFIEIMFVLSGSVTHHIERQTYTYVAGQCCVMNKNIHHREIFSGNFQAVFFLFQDDFLAQLLEEYHEFMTNTKQTKIINPIYQMLAINKNAPFHLDKMYLDYFPLIPAERIIHDMKPFFNAIVAETISQEPGSNFLIKGVFARFFHKLNDPALYNFKAVESHIQGQEYLFGKIVHIMEMTHGRAKREDLVRQLHYNGEYLNRIVKKHTGKTINEYGQQIFLEEARTLLAETNLSISTIITKLGFSNYSYFYRLFENAYGETPQNFRKNHKKRQA